MATKQDSMVTYLETILPTHLFDHLDLATRTCKVMWQSQIIISPLPQCLQPNNLGGRCFILRSSSP